MAHNTWNSYQNMLRIIKKYRLQFREGPRGEKREQQRVVHRGGALGGALDWSQEFFLCF